MPKLPNKPVQAPHAARKQPPAIIAEELSPWGDASDVDTPPVHHDYFHVEGYSDVRTQRENAVARGERPDPLKWRLQYVSIVNPMGGGHSGRKAGEFQAKGYTPVLYDECAKYGIDPKKSGFTKAPDGTCVVGGTQMLMAAPAKIAAGQAKAQRELTQALSEGRNSKLERAVDAYNASYPGATPTSIIEEESLHKD